MRNLLITAFEPFSGDQTNVSQQVLDSIKDFPNVHKVVLPVSFCRAPKMLRQAVRGYNPDAIIMLGQCGAGDNLRLERFAVNLMDANRADNDGFTPNEQVISRRAKTAYITSFPIKQWKKELINDGHKVTLSNSAGLYVCNRVYFEALYHKLPALFIHIPRTFPIIDAKSVVNELIRLI